MGRQIITEIRNAASLPRFTTVRSLHSHPLKSP